MMQFHAEGHRVLVSSIASESGDSSHTLFFCEDPTCDWCVSEFHGRCKDFVNFDSDLLTSDVDDLKKRYTPAGDQGQEAAGQTSLFGRGEGR